MKLNGSLAQFSARRLTLVLSTFVCLALLTGCSRAPSFNVLGSYFPGWIICAFVAAILTILAHWYMGSKRLMRELWPPQVIYTLLFITLTCLLWLTLFNS